MKKTRRTRNAAKLGSLDTNTSSSTAVSTRDKLVFTLFVAAIVHAVIVLGISFSAYGRHRPPPTLAITLAQHAEKQAPDKADYLAQHHQEASGSLENKAELTTDRRADFADTTIREVNPDKPKQKAIKETVRNQQIVTTRRATDHKVQQEKQKKDEASQAEIPGEDEEDNITNDEIASLQAKLAQQRQAYAKRPRIKTLTSVATRASVDAEYLNLWQEKIELIGNLNYPPEARRQKIYGQLRLVVSLLPDGSIHNIEILQSSGQRILDDAAIRIVRLAAPFAPFPPELRKDVDQLEIIRTWKFEKGDKLTSQ
ncbi:MAG: energy transducer TonB [Pseudomonadales bacterium]|nr:energy transducer TonB [Pseudomonadales bacterium]